ncbi:MAG TPA: efflux RND transporter periplasmic adaptor subunit [Gemmatimonadaceae bacterium]|nr:efflux RND transporter periplasmic adaptor subunit [Gemmatimonadaceae bacterium]
MKRIVGLSVAIGVLAMAGVALARGGMTRPDATAESATTVRVIRRDLGSQVKATGVIKPRVGAEVRVGSRISGVVRRLYVQIGDSVAKGQLLAELDDRDLVARRDEAEATLRQLETSLGYARTNLRRMRELSNARVIAPADLDVAERTASVAEQQVDGARASLSFQSAQLAYTRIVAPIAGVVASVSTQEGETVAASFAAPTFLTLLDPSRLEVWAYVDETDIGRIRAGQRAQFTVDTYGDHEFDGRVTAVHPTAEIRDNVVDYVAVVEFKPPRDRTLRPEMTTTVRIALETREHALAVPIRAVRWQGARAYVLSRRTGADTVERRWVTTGIKDESYYEILSGLAEGDEVLIGDVNVESGGTA